MNQTHQIETLEAHIGDPVRPRFKTYRIEAQSNAEPIYTLSIGDQQSEVTGDILLANCFPIPPTPIYRTWRNLVQSNMRCGHCWEEVYGPEDLRKHEIDEHGGKHCGEAC